MAKSQSTSCVTCSKCGEIILICVGTELAEQFSVKCAACTLRRFYHSDEVQSALSKTDPAPAQKSALRRSRA